MKSRAKLMVAGSDDEGFSEDEEETAGAGAGAVVAYHAEGEDSDASDVEDFADGT